MVVAAAVLAGCAAPPEDVGSSDEAVKVCGQTTVKGVDVYHGDNGGKTIDWTKVKSAGISFAFAKATESTNFVDSASRRTGPHEVGGLVRGAYHFFHADVDPTAAGDASSSRRSAQLEPGDFLVLDIETTNGQTQATVLAHAVTFLAAVKTATGKTPILYTSPAFLSSYPGRRQYPLWVANYGVSCPTVPARGRRTRSGRAPGPDRFRRLAGALDLDSFNGTLDDLLAFGTPDAAATDAAPLDEAAAPPLDASDGSDAGGAEPGSSGCGCVVGREPPRAGSLLALDVVALAAARRKPRRATRV